MTASAIVLCGGRSSRMGRDKALLRFGTETSTARVTRLVREVTSDIVLVGAAAPGGATGPEAVDDPGEGPLVAFGVGLDRVSAGHALLVACDMPLLRPALVRHLCAAVGTYDACVPRIDGMPMPLCAVYARHVDGVVRSLVAAGERSMRALLDRVSVRWVEASELRAVDPDLQSFLDCDTPEDYRRALELAGFGANTPD